MESDYQFIEGDPVGLSPEIFHFVSPSPFPPSPVWLHLYAPRQIYLEKLMISPLLKDSKIKHGIMNRRTVHESIVDALDYLVKLIGNFLT